MLEPLSFKNIVKDITDAILERLCKINCQDKSTPSSDQKIPIYLQAVKMLLSSCCQTVSRHIRFSNHFNISNNFQVQAFSSARVTPVKSTKQQ